MSKIRGALPLNYHRISRSELGMIGLLDLGLEQISRFLGPLPDIVDAVRRGLAHAMIGIEAGGELIGFYVVHPDARDRSCWWLGWFAIDCRRQGNGYGRTAMAAILDRLRQIPGCRRIRLLVAPDNPHALKLYRQAGFRQVGVSKTTAELIMERTRTETIPPSQPGVVVRTLFLAIELRLARSHCQRVSSGKQSSGASHGPPGSCPRA